MIIENFYKTIEQNRKKFIIDKPGGATIPLMVDIIETENFYIVYCHTKGNYWNISGRHYTYCHDKKTGEYLHSGRTEEKEIGKERFLLKHYKQFMKLCSNL